MEVAVKEGLPLTTVVPSLSLSQMRYCLGLPNEQEKIYVADATPGAVAKRCCSGAKPALDKLRMVVNPRFRDTVAAACENLYADVVSNEGSNDNNCVTGEYANHLTSGQRRVLSDMLEDHALGNTCAYLVVKGRARAS